MREGRVEPFLHAHPTLSSADVRWSGFVLEHYSVPAWEGPTHRIAVALHPRLLVSALDETAHESDIELTEHWNLIDPQITAVLLAMTTDLNEGSPAGRLYGDSLGNALADYLLNRYTVRRYAPVAY